MKFDEVFGTCTLQVTVAFHKFTAPGTADIYDQTLVEEVFEEIARGITRDTNAALKNICFSASTVLANRVVHSTVTVRKNENGAEGVRLVSETYTDSCDAEELTVGYVYYGGHKQLSLGTSDEGVSTFFLEEDGYLRIRTDGPLVKKQVVNEGYVAMGQRDLERELGANVMLGETSLIINREEAGAIGLALLRFAKTGKF